MVRVLGTTTGDHVTEIDDVRDGGVSRRTMLKRSALVGGSLVWVTPAVQSIGATAFAETTDGSPKPGKGVGPSNVVILVECGGLYYTAKIDSDDALFVCGGDAQPPNAQPDDPNARTAWNARLASLGITPEASHACPTGVTATSLGPTVPSCFEISGDCTVIDWIVFDGALTSPRYRFKGEQFPTGWEVPDSGQTSGSLCFSKPA
jgi:hypothetical protein